MRSHDAIWDHVMLYDNVINIGSCKVILYLAIYTAECCVSLRNLIGDSPETVVRPLTHSALAVGEIE